MLRAEFSSMVAEQRTDSKQKRMRMESYRTLLSSIYLLLYLIFISLSISLVHTFLGRLILGNHPVKIKRTAPLPLRFSYDGTFKILQVADLHYGNGVISSCRDVLPDQFSTCSDLNSTQFLRKLIQVEKPHFVAFTGDNIFGSSTPDAAESLIKAFVPVVESKLPWAAILGNHDHESTMNREELMTFISAMDYSVSQVNPYRDDSSVAKGRGTHVDGFGNCNVEVKGAFGSDLANTSILDLYFLDSGDRATVGGIRTYGWIKESQLNWLQTVSKELQGKRNMTDSSSSIISSTPALAFFHIPIPEVRQLWYSGYVGQFQEGVACSSVNSGVLRTLVSMGDVKAVFMGHDHTNDFCGRIDGIWFCYGGGFGYHGYGKVGWSRRARIIYAELEKGQRGYVGVQRIKTWKRLDDEELSKIDEQVLWDKLSYI